MGDGALPVRVKAHRVRRTVYVNGRMGESCRKARRVGHWTPWPCGDVEMAPANANCCPPPPRCWARGVDEAVRNMVVTPEQGRASHVGALAVDAWCHWERGSLRSAQDQAVVWVGLYLPRTAEEEVAEEEVLVMSPSLNFASFFAAFWSSVIRPAQQLPIALPIVS